MSRPRTRLVPALLLLALPCARAGADVPPEPVPPRRAPEAAPAPNPAPTPDGAQAGAETGVAFEPGAPAYADVLAKAKASGRPLFLDFFTEWCGYCKKLDKETYARADVAKTMEAFVSVRVDAEKGEGVELTKRFGIRGFPTLVVVGADDAEVDRIVGYLPPEPFQKEVRRILAGEGTIPALRASVDAHPDDLALGVSLGKRLVAANAPDAAARLEGLAAKAAGKDPEAEAAALTALATLDVAAGRLVEAFARIDRVSTTLRDTAAAKDARRLVPDALLARGRADPEEALALAARLRAGAKDGVLDAETEQAVARLHVRAAERAMTRAAVAAGDDPQRLNELAWSCFERRIALVPATEWAKTAAERSGRDPAILDTLANLYAAQKRHDDAIATEIEALGRVPASGDALRKELERNLAGWIAARDAARADAAPAARRGATPTKAPTAAPSVPTPAK